MTRMTGGIIRPKRSRQVALSRIQPDSVGPRAGARPMTTPPRPIMVPRLSAGKMTNKTVWMVGKVMPTPIA